MSVVIYGPQGCGKSRAARQLAEHYGCTAISDDGRFRYPHTPAEWHAFDSESILFLTHEPPPLGCCDRRIIAFETAINEAFPAYSNANGPAFMGEPVLKPAEVETDGWRAAIRAVEEPSGPMPDSVWQSIRLGREATENAIRCVIRLTKKEAESNLEAYFATAGRCVGAADIAPAQPHAAQFELWFFRDLVNRERLALLGLCGYPVEELRSRGMQRLALRDLLQQAAAVEGASPAQIQPPTEPRFIADPELPTVIQDTTLGDERGLRVEGLFVEGERWRYANAIAEALNRAGIQEGAS